MRHSYKCTAEMHSRCSNNALCHLCDGETLFKDPVGEKKEKFRVREENKEAAKKAAFKTHKKEKKEGMGFEKRVAAEWNNKFGTKKKKTVAKPRFDVESIGAEPKQPVPEEETTVYKASKPLPIRKKTPPKRDEAQRQFNSGAFWHSKGDIKLEHALMECKERGTTNARGEKQITIPKLWLEKQEKEAFQENRPYWYIPFGYKNDPSIYLVKPYDHEIEMIYEMRQSREEIERLQARVKELEEKLNDNQ